MRVLITGVAGFIGAALAHHLLDQGEEIIGVDNLNDYYDVRLKLARLERLRTHSSFHFLTLDIAERRPMNEVFDAYRFDAVVHLAAQVGVRYAVENPSAYVDANIVGFMNVLEGCRHSGVGHLVFASSSSVYGANARLPYSEHDNVDHPVSLYAASKKANELMAHSYAHLYGLSCTGLRFFTVYGPWGRPDMAPFRFTEGILAGRAIPVFNRGDMVRDFTYIDDIVEGTVRIVGRPAAPALAWDSDNPDPATSYAPWRIYNIGNSEPIKLMHFINALEQCLGREAIIDLLPIQPGEVKTTIADVSELEEAVGFRPRTSIEEGVAKFVAWYKDYYKIQ